MSATETESVYKHRVNYALSLGFSVDQSEILAASNIDIHDIASLINRGCDKYLALEIVR